MTYKPVKKLASDVGYFRTCSKFSLVELCCGPISLSMKICHSPRWRTVSTLMYIAQSHLKIFYFLKSKLLYMGKFHHVEAKAIKREQLKHHQILYILRNIFVYWFKKKKRKNRIDSTHLCCESICLNMYALFQVSITIPLTEWCIWFHS